MGNESPGSYATHSLILRSSGGYGDCCILGLPRLLPEPPWGRQNLCPSSGDTTASGNCLLGSVPILNRHRVQETHVRPPCSEVVQDAVAFTISTLLVGSILPSPAQSHPLPSPPLPCPKFSYRPPVLLECWWPFHLALSLSAN